ncbi:peptidoglycan recognition family protein, partial [Catellatospora sp. NPDC049609]|uniref:N-acetylmuramoyl-L-alanine amidase n=1 Tax=Catellatospora sp. NPDC049609 TaxID=3155505 RepID=UPI00342BCB19
MKPHPPRHRRAATLLGAALTGALLLAAAPASASGAPAAPATGLDAAFATAAKTYQVPRDLLVAVGFGETRLIDHDGLPSQDNGYGVMHLADNPRNRSLPLAARLTGLDTATLKTDAAANVRGAAAVLRAYADRQGLTGADRGRIAAWYPVVAAYAGAGGDATARLSADHVYALLQQGIVARTERDVVAVAPSRVRPELGRFAAVQPAGAVSTAAPQGAAAAAVPVPQYPGARWIPASTANYGAGRSAAITTIVIHVTQGSYAGTISWFQNPSAGVSAHYVVKSSNGEVTQMVRDEDTGYHARSGNPYSLGIEHEGFVDNPAWFTDAMYRSSANLSRHLANRWGIPKTRANIRGHNEIPGNNHTDPGPHWNWNYYMSLVNSGGGGAQYL